MAERVAQVDQVGVGSGAPLDDGGGGGGEGGAGGQHEGEPRGHGRRFVCVAGPAVSGEMRLPVLASAMRPTACDHRSITG